LLRLVFDARSERLGRRLAFGARSWMHRAILGRARRRSVALPFEQVLSHEIYALLADPGFRRRLAAPARTDDQIAAVVSTLVSRIFARYVERIATAGRDNVVGTIREIVTLVSSNLFVSLPYFLSYFHQSSDRFIVRDVRRAFAIAEREKLVLVTDTFFEINGVSRTIRRMLHEALRRDVDLTVVTCLADGERERCH